MKQEEAIAKMRQVVNGGWDWYSQNIYGTQFEDEYKETLSEIQRFETEMNVEKGTIAYIGLQTSKFDENVLQLCVYVFDEESKCGDFWTGDLDSQRFIENTGGKTPLDIAKENLESIGFTGGDDLLSFAAQFFGKTNIPCWVAKKTAKKSGKDFFMISRLGHGKLKPQKALNFNIFKAGGNFNPAQQPQAQSNPFGNAPQAQKQPQVASNPFGNMSPF